MDFKQMEEQQAMKFLIRYHGKIDKFTSLSCSLTSLIQSLSKSFCCQYSQVLSSPDLASSEVKTKKERKMNTQFASFAASRSISLIVTPRSPLRNTWKKTILHGNTSSTSTIWSQKTLQSSQELSLLLITASRTKISPGSLSTKQFVSKNTFISTKTKRMSRTTTMWSFKAAVRSW